MATLRARIKSRAIRIKQAARWGMIGITGWVSRHANRLMNQPFYRRALRHSITFQPSMGSTVRIIPESIHVVKAPHESDGGRPMVVALINGKRLYFYKSSGKRSGRPGKWLPTSGIRPTIRWTPSGIRFTGVEGLVKMKSHWNPNPYPQEIVEIGEKIGELEKQGKIPTRWMSIRRVMEFQARWGLWPSYEKYNEAAEPYLETQ